MLLARKCLGGISFALGLTSLILCVWLLIAALTDPQCKHFDKYDPEYTRGRDAIEYKRRVFERGPNKYLWGRNLDFTVWENIEEYCVYAVENWTIGGGLGIAMAILQLITSTYLLFTDFGDIPLSGSSWTVIWFLGHVVFAGGYGGSLYAGLLGEVNKSHNQVIRVGKVFCGVMGVNAGLCILLSILTCFWIRRGQVVTGQRSDSMQKSEFIPKARIK